MCVGFWSLDVEEYSLVLCTNRDEYLSRPTLPAQWHSFDFRSSDVSNTGTPLMKLNLPDGDRKGSVLSGIDVLAGGTWFGINRRGEIALLTNITEPTPNLHSSRGHLCSSFLLRNTPRQSGDLSEFVTELTNSEARYSGFNLLLLAPSHVPPNSEIGPDASSKDFRYNAAFLTNGGAGNPVVAVSHPELDGVCGGISNSSWNRIDPYTGLQVDLEWPKVIQGRRLLSNVLYKHSSENVLIEELFGILRCKTHSPPGKREEFRENILIQPVDFGAWSRGPPLATQDSRVISGPTHPIKTSREEEASLCCDKEQKPWVAKKEDLMPPNPPPLSETSSGRTNSGSGSGSATLTNYNVHDEAYQGSRTASLSEPAVCGGTRSQSKYYATRLSTVVLVRKNGEVLFIERDMWAFRENGPRLAEHNADNGHNERRFRFRLEE
ncbi:hypothetical protein K439DRAFT_1397035 [Ramaria rubella]|nr:hypothetical protein K439DRAFT_1397035 [Ramaria rubella]